MQGKPEQDGDEGEYVELTWEAHATGRFKDDKWCWTGKTVIWLQMHILLLKGEFRLTKHD